MGGANGAPMGAHMGGASGGANGGCQWGAKSKFKKKNRKKYFKFKKSTKSTNYSLSAVTHTSDAINYDNTHIIQKAFNLSVNIGLQRSIYNL